MKLCLQIFQLVECFLGSLSAVCLKGVGNQKADFLSQHQINHKDRGGFKQWIFNQITDL